MFIHLKLIYYFTLLRNRNIEHFFDLLFVTFAPLTRSSVYLVGIIVGYYIDKWESKKKEKKFDKKLRNITILFPILWILSLVFLHDILAFFDFGRLAACILEPTNKMIGALIFGHFIIMCHFSGFGNVNRFLSMYIWKVITRLSYCIYLVHPVIQTFLVSITPKQTNFEFLHLVRQITLCEYFD